jgi:putative phage-type endonuclease
MGDLMDTDIYRRSVQLVGEPPQIGHAVPVMAEALGRGEWLDNRVIGASDAAGILGMSRHGSPLSVYRSIVYGERATENYHMRRGNALESVALRELKEFNGIEAVKPGWLLRHPERSYMTCTLDGWGDDGWGYGVPVECKAPGDHVVSDMQALIDGEEINPVGAVAGYVVQLRYQMEVTGAESGWLVVLPGTRKPMVAMVLRDEAFARQMLESIEAFWEMCKARQEPEALPYDLEAIAKAWRRKHGELETKSEKVLELMRQYEKAQALVREQDKVLDELKDIAAAIKAKLVQRAASIGASKLVVLDGERRHSITHSPEKTETKTTTRKAAFRVNLSRK